LLLARRSMTRSHVRVARPWHSMRVTLPIRCGKFFTHHSSSLVHCSAKYSHSRGLVCAFASKTLSVEDSQANPGVSHTCEPTQQLTKKDSDSADIENQYASVDGVHEGPLSATEFDVDKDANLQPFKNIVVNNVRCLASLEKMSERLQDFRLEMSELLSRTPVVPGAPRRSKWIVIMQYVY
jgi:hypothetical protein